MTERTYRTQEACALAGITPRQADYWARHGVGRPSIADAKGSGTPRLYSHADVVVLRAVAQLVSARDQDRLRTARNVEPHVREVLEHAAGDVYVVVHDTGASVANNADELLAAVHEHQAVHVLHVHVNRDAAGAHTPADVNTSAAVTSCAAAVG